MLFGHQKDYSEAVAAEIDAEVKKILDFNYARTKKILTENRELLDNLAKLLLEKETVYKEEIDLLIEGKSVEDIIKLMDKKEKARILKDKKQKELGEKQAKLRSLQTKLDTSKYLLDQEIISQEEYDSVKKLCEELQAEIEQETKPKRKKPVDNQDAEAQAESSAEKSGEEVRVQQEKPAEEQGDKQ